MPTIYVHYHLSHNELSRELRNTVCDRLWQVRQMFDKPEQIERGNVADQYVRKLLEYIDRLGLEATLTAQVLYDCFPSSGRAEDPEEDVLTLRLQVEHGRSDSRLLFVHHAELAALLRDSIEWPLCDEVQRHLMLTSGIDYIGQL